MPTWNVSLGSLWRTYRVQGRRAASFVKQGTLTQSAEGRLELQTKFDPPGSGWIAFGAAIVTGILVQILAQQFGFCAGPGWLIWFLAIVALRRREVTINLPDAEAVVIDQTTRRMAFKSQFEGKPRWIAFEAPLRFGEVVEAVSSQMPGRKTEGKIDRALTPTTIVLIALVILFIVMIILSIVGAALFMGRRRPVRVAPALMLASVFVGPALITLSGLFRRNLHTAE